MNEEIVEKSYAQSIGEKYSGKLVEILFDSDWGTREYFDFSIQNKATIIGRIIKAEGNCIEVVVDINSGKTSFTKVLLINAWNILSVSEFEDKTSQVFAFTRQVLGKQ